MSLAQSGYAGPTREVIPARRSPREEQFTIGEGVSSHTGLEPRAEPEPYRARQMLAPHQAQFLSNPAPVARFAPSPDRKHCVLNVQIHATICPCPHFSFW